MGEYHPAEKKVVVQFSPADMGLTPAQADKLRKLAGPRYNPTTDVIKMSSEKYEHQAQNKRYLSDLVDKLIEAAKVRLHAIKTACRGPTRLTENDYRTPRTLLGISL